MAVYRTIPVDQQPALTAIHWSVRELPGGDHHIVSWVVENREGRVSRRIASFDSATATAVTGSGRVYRLQGRPGGHPDAEYVWAIWCRRNDIEAHVDVTAEYWTAIQSAS